MPSLPLREPDVPATYPELRRAVEQTLLAGQREIEQAKVLTYWRTGALISAHLRLHEARPGYGTATMARLARDLKVSDTVLYRCVRFHECFPILARGPKLTWAHYRALIPIADPAQRRRLETVAAKEGWTAERLLDETRTLRLAQADAASSGPGSPAPPSTLPKQLSPRRGTPGLFAVVSRGGAFAVDLGFKLYRSLGEDLSRHLAVGEIVRLEAERPVRIADAAKADLFTYTADVRRLVDGDTLVAAIEVLPGIFLEEKLRLRGLDAPEIATAAGRAAKRFVESLLAGATGITLCTTKPDKYDRYLADVFIATAAGDVFLNNALLANGHAVTKEAWEFGDWEKELL